ncbi:M20 metallopeptidase family protein [Clostridium manihotivorum]|uniref:Amidohydrolase n=1 Tax=Clostridium manihotivorum TaxID=2320868 RepID=A0A3R5U7T4_9CLOT|nr:M20/M25/M40 family metallo-hydrolase [Clostridium manihotivorum]QAA31124.1 hypothetical protein C1I91_05285 [Clostridium manihotivorum]
MLEDLEELKEIRHDLHKIPEIAMAERKTRGYIERYIGNNAVSTKITHNSELGLVAMKVNGDNYPAIAFRAELDALPIKDTKSVSYCSEHEGMCHACGHDVHMAILLKLIKFLDTERLKVNLVYVFQAGEEVYAGAKKLSRELTNYDIAFMYSLHITPNLPVGYYSLSSDVMLAAALMAEVEVKLKQGHIAEKTDFLKVLSTIESFQKQYNNEDRIFKVTNIETNGYYNVTPSKLKLLINFRGVNIEEVTLDYQNFIRDLSEKLTVNSDIISKYPALKNDKKLSELTRALFEKRYGRSYVLKCPFLMSSDDFSYYGLTLEGIKTCYFFIGSYLGDDIEVHTENFDVNEQCLYYGYDALKTVVSFINNKIE